MQSGSSFRLTVQRGPQPNQQYPLTRDTLTLGRDITNDIVINDPEVSRHHARLIRTAAGYTLEDLKSTNGTFINKQQRLVGSIALNAGDQVGLGETVVLIYEAYGGAQAATVVGTPDSAQPMPQSQPPRRPAPAPAPAVPSAYAPSSGGYEDEEEFEPDNNRMIIMGCGGLTLLFCCVVIVGLIAVDSMNLWCDLPIISTQLFSC